MYGHNVSHSKRRTVRTFKPNLHSTRIATGGRSIKIRLCTKCQRTIKAENVVTKQVIPQQAVAA